MSTKSVVVAIFFAAAVSTFLAAADRAIAASPTLFGKPDGIDDDRAVPLELDTLQLDVVVVGELAEVTLHAGFSYHDEGFSEGTFEMQLPVGAVVTGYALDVGDDFIDGVLVPRAKARIAFEERVRGRVDPGLGEISRGNVFATRVFPVDRGGRRIRLSFVAPFDAARRLTVPLQSTAPVGAASISVRSEGTATPRVTLPAGFTASAHAGAAVIESARRDAVLAGSLIVTAAEPPGIMIVSAGADGRKYYQLRAEAPAATPRPAGRVRVYWDVSRSRRDQDLAREAELLGALLARLRTQTVDFVAFNSSGAATTEGLDVERTVRAIGALEYRGASSFTALGRGGLPRADRCLLFSDGIVTIDARASLPRGCRTDAIVSTRDADLAYLRRITAETGGGAWSLATGRSEDIVDGIAVAAPRPVAARDERGEPLTLAQLEGGLLVGQAPAMGPLIVTYSDSRGVEREQRYRTATRTAPFTGTGALWAAARVAELESKDGLGAEAESLARRHSVATARLSFLVLDTPADYVEERIAPPSTYPDALRLEYDEIEQQHDAEHAELAREHRDGVVSQWRELKDWWKEDHSDFGFDSDSFSADDLDQASADGRRIAAPRGGGGGGGGGGGIGNNGGVGWAEEIVVTGSRIVPSPGSAGPSIAIEIEPWSADRPYIAALDRASAATLDLTLQNEERRHGELPAFYIDVARWLDAKGQSTRALETLLSALDLATTDEATRLTVADLLAEWGQGERAVSLYEQLRADNRGRPQPLRWLAMALARSGDPAATARAVELLLQVVLTPWEEADDGIAMISLLDANALLSRLTAAERAALRIDPRLVAALHFDLRVTLEWNTEATDMDLWITEPTDEEVYYDNPDSELGGRLSNDMTQGYGPEEYLLRRAPAGTYEIAVDAYAADRLNPNGATVVTARLIRDFGRRTQKEETLKIELDPEDEDEHLVGRFVVAR